jgi:hypothetical protein
MWESDEWGEFLNKKELEDEDGIVNQKISTIEQFFT